MAQVAERRESYLAGFDAFRRSSAFGAQTARDVREAAFSRFLATGLPTTRDEEWRFTNIAPIAETAFVRATVDTVLPEVAAPVLFEEACGTAVIVNGHLSSTLSSLAYLPEGLTVRSFNAHAPNLDLSEVSAVGVFGDLNTAFCEATVVIEVAPKTIVDRPLHLVLIAAPGEEPALSSPRILIIVGEEAQASMVETHIDEGRLPVFVNVVTNIRVAPAGILDHVKIQRQGPASFHIASVVATMGRAGTLTSHSVTLGGRISRNDITSVLQGEGAECTLNGLYVAGGETLVDNHTTIDHASAHCPSHEVYKGILTGRAKAVFNGKIIVRPDAQKTNAKQTNKALLLTDDAQINSKPQLEIFADDVKCTHGATVGQLDEEAMFYLQARGISALVARNMLIHAFAGDVLNGIKSDAVRQSTMRLVDDMLSLDAQ